MALMTKIERIEKQQQRLHGPTDCCASVVQTSDGARYLQLDTFGSADRKIPGKVSQSIQFDAVAAAQLKALIAEVFPRLE